MIRHSHVSGIPNDPTKDVSSDRWNEAHVIEDGSITVEHLEADVQEVIAGAVLEGDPRLTDARTPTAHTHPPSEVEGTAIIEGDSRLSDARTPTSHTHPASAITGLTADRVVIADTTTGAVTTDGALIWDNANKRLGIGAAPSYAHDIVTTGIAASPVNSTDFTQVRAALRNTTPSTSGAQTQNSPALMMEGHVWQSGSGGSDKTLRYLLQGRVVPAVSGPTMFLAFSEFNGTGSTDEIYVGVAKEGDTPSLRIRDGNIFFKTGGRGICFVSAPLTDAFDANFVLSGDTTSGNKRIKFTTVNGWVFIEGNNSGTLGTNPSMDFRNFDQSFQTPVIGIRHRATPGASVGIGFGTRQLYQASSSTTADQDQGAFDMVWNDKTHASRSADFVVNLVHGAAALAEKFRMRSSGQFDAGTLAITDGVTAPAAATGKAILYVDTADGDLKVVFADGTVKTIVTD